MDPFIYTAHPARVIFGAGCLEQLRQELDLLAASRVLIVTTASQRPHIQNIQAAIGARIAGVFDEAVMHVPVEVARQATSVARTLNADCVVAIGGGSAIGVAKAIVLDTSLPLLAIPTTYAGSEMTSVYGITQDGVKTTGKDARVLPRTVIYDPALTSTLPAGISVTSAFNAMAHAVEGMYSKDRNPVMSLMALEGIKALANAIPGFTRDPANLEIRAHALYGAWLCGTVLCHVGMSLHHKLCHTLGGSFNLPHAQVHTIVLPHAVAYNTPAEPEVMRRISSALGSASAAAGIYDMAKQAGAPTALKELGMTEADLDKAAEIAMSAAYWNPRPLQKSAIRSLLQDAWVGARPSEGITAQ